jgi:hypothetical protein
MKFFEILDLHVVWNAKPCTCVRRPSSVRKKNTEDFDWRDHNPELVAGGGKAIDNAGVHSHQNISPETLPCNNKVLKACSSAFLVSRLWQERFRRHHIAA